eukprot:10595000-Lingulodinium_polyedra.AAC.1
MALALVRPTPPASAGPRRAVWRRNGGTGTASAPEGMRAQCWVCLERFPVGEGVFRDKEKSGRFECHAHHRAISRIECQAKLGSSGAEKN